MSEERLLGDGVIMISIFSLKKASATINNSLQLKSENTTAPQAYQILAKQLNMCASKSIIAKTSQPEQPLAQINCSNHTTKTILAITNTPNKTIAT